VATLSDGQLIPLEAHAHQAFFTGGVAMPRAPPCVRRARITYCDRQASRREPTRLYLRLDVATAGEADVRDLLRREQECCAFFNFDVQPAGDVLMVQAHVPDGADECLDDLERLTIRVHATHE
jgi:hypothetical protein